MSSTLWPKGQFLIQNRILILYPEYLKFRKNKHVELFTEMKKKWLCLTLAYRLCSPVFLLFDHVWNCCGWTCYRTQPKDFPPHSVYLGIWPPKIFKFQDCYFKRFIVWSKLNTHSHVRLSVNILVEVDGVSNFITLNFFWRLQKLGHSKF